MPEIYRRCVLEKRLGDGTVLSRLFTIEQAMVTLSGPLKMADEWGQIYRGWWIVAVLPEVTDGDDPCVEYAPVVVAEIV